MGSSDFTPRAHFTPRGGWGRWTTGSSDFTPRAHFTPRGGWEALDDGLSLC